jgi:hypothetical protein
MALSRSGFSQYVSVYVYTIDTMYDVCESINTTESRRNANNTADNQRDAINTACSQRDAINMADNRPNSINTA